MMSTTASLGLILLWDVDAGLTQIDKYLYSTEDYIKVKSDVISMSRKFKKRKKNCSHSLDLPICHLYNFFNIKVPVI